MFPFAICQELFEGWDWQRQCRFIAETGYTGIEVAPFTLANRITDLSDETLKLLRAQAEDHGLQIVGLHWLLAKTEGLHLTTADRKTRQATSEYLKALGEACGKMGGTVMVFGSPFQRNLEPGVPYAQALEHAREVFQDCMPAIAGCGVTICMEPLTAKETDFIRTCSDAKTLIEMVDHPNFRLHQDVKAMLGAETQSLPRVIEEFKSLTAHFHVNDTNLLGPGMGETDYRPIFEALLKSGYSGWVSVEVFDYSPGAEVIARESMSYMKRVLAELESRSIARENREG